MSLQYRLLGGHPDSVCNTHEDCYNADYTGAPTDAAWLNAGNCELRVVRGGSWNPKDKEKYSRSAFRICFPASTAITVVGFRPARR